MNYFSYFSEIEDTFIRRRGKHLMLSPIDWALIESWKERGVPLHVALRGIEHAFDSHEAKKHKRTIKTLMYCQEEVEAQYAEWLQSRVGSHDEQAESASETMPFSRGAIVNHLSRSLDEIRELSNERKQEDILNEALARAAALLNEIRDEYASSPNPDTRKLEESLTGVDRLLDDSIRAVVTEAELASIVSEIESQIKPYKRHMDKATFEQTRNNLLRKRLRDHFGVPRLSLFYL